MRRVLVVVLLLPAFGLPARAMAAGDDLIVAGSDGSRVVVQRDPLAAPPTPRRTC